MLEHDEPVYSAIPISVNVPGLVSIISVPFAPARAEYQTSPSLLPPSQVASGIVEFVAPELEPVTAENDVPTVSEVAVQGSSPARAELIIPGRD